MSIEKKVNAIESYPLQVKEELFISIETLEDLINDLSLEESVKEKIFGHKLIQRKLNHQLKVIEEPIDSVFTQSVLIDQEAYELIKKMGTEKLLERLKIEYFNAMEYLFHIDLTEDDGFIEEIKNHIEENINKMEEWDTETIFQWHSHGSMQGIEHFVEGTLEFQIRAKYEGEYCTDGLWEYNDFEINKIWNLKQSEIVEGKHELDDSEEAIKENKRRTWKIWNN